MFDFIKNPLNDNRCWANHERTQAYKHKTSV
jgi:hypothetical protein